MDRRFYGEVDKQSTFRTRNILCVPLVSRKDECIGVLQALNKTPGEFMDDDLASLTSISHYVTIALENSQLYQEVKEYSEELRQTLARLEELERVKRQLTKFVPTSVASLVEEDPVSLGLEKRPMDVTVLFIDIQGFSTITENFDQNLVNHMVENHFSQYLDCIHRRGGEVNETSGDGLMVLFKEGPPQITAQAAVLAGLEIIERNKTLNDELSYPWGRVELHLGINTGRAWVGSTKMRSLTGERWTYTASGMVTVLAARIGAFSERTRLYVGEETFSLLTNRFHCDFQGSRKGKNVKKPIPIYWAKACSNVEE
jgi:class 3 adenylate cyclase